MDADEVIADPDEAESGAASFFKVCAYIGAGLIALDAIVSGVLLGAVFSKFAGFIIGLGGIACAGMVVSFCRVFLDTAKDARATKKLLLSYIQKCETAKSGRKRTMIKGR